MKIKFENLTNWHIGLFNKMLNADFPGKNQIRSQLDLASFEIIDNNRSVEMFCEDCVPANVIHNVPVEVEGIDIDGIIIHGMLFVSKGRIYLFEISKEDGTEIVEFPEVEDFNVIIGFAIADLR